MYNREKIIAMLREIAADNEQIKPYVAMLQPRRNLEEIAAQNLDEKTGNLHIDVMGYAHGFGSIGGEKVDVARNYLLEQGLDCGAKYLLFVGEDTVLPYDAFYHLHKTAEANPGSVVVGVYYVKLSVPMIMIKTEENWVIPANVDPGQVFEIYTSGLDCALIPTSILKKMKEDDPELPFCCMSNSVEGLPSIGEDNFFECRLRKSGFRLLVNTDVQCLHMDLASGKYTAHPNVNLTHYYTNIPITERLVLDDKEVIDKRWIDRIPCGK